MTNSAQTPKSELFGGADAVFQTGSCPQQTLVHFLFVVVIVGGSQRQMRASTDFNVFHFPPLPHCVFYVHDGYLVLFAYQNLSSLAST